MELHIHKRDKKGGTPWKPIDIQRARHPNLNTYSFVSKALNVNSRLDFI